MRQIVPFIPATSGNPVTVSSEVEKTEEACHGFGRDIERSPLRRGAIDCVGDSNEMNGEYNQS